MTPQDLIARFDELAEAPNGLEQLRGLVLDLGVRGALVPQLISDTDSGTTTTQELTASDAACPPGWSIRRFGDLFVEIITGPFGTSLKASDYVPVGVPVVNPQNLKQGRIVPRADTCIGQDTLARLATFRLHTDDVVVARRGEMGRCAVVTAAEDGWLCGTGSLILRPPTHVDSEFVAIFLRCPSTVRRLVGDAVGATMQNLNQRILLALSFPVPPLAEQKRIVARVDELMKLIDQLDAARTRREQARVAFRDSALSALQTATTTEEVDLAWVRVRERFDELITASDAGVTEGAVRTLAVRGLLGGADVQLSETALTPFVLPIGWEWVTLDDVVDPERPIGYGVLVPGAHDDNGVPLVRVAELDPINTTPTPEKAISATIAAQFQRTRLRGDELLLGVVGSIGKVGVAHPSWNGAVIARAVARIAVRADVERDYVLLILQSPFMQAYFREVSRTLAQPTLNVGLIRAAPFPLPPPAIQRTVAVEARRLLESSRAADVALQAARAAQMRFAASASHFAAAAEILN